jgi:hypothetical protein
MKRLLSSLSVVLVVVSWATHSQSQSQPPASSTASAQTPRATGGKAAKVWTNDDVDLLHDQNTVSVVGNNVGTRKSRGASQSTSYEKDPAWYRKQLAPLQAKCRKVRRANREAAGVYQRWECRRSSAPPSRPARQSSRPTESAEKKTASGCGKD